RASEASAPMAPRSAACALGRQAPNQAARTDALADPLGLALVYKRLLGPKLTSPNRRRRRSHVRGSGPPLRSRVAAAPASLTHIPKGVFVTDLLKCAMLGAALLLVVDSAPG